MLIIIKPKVDKFKTLYLWEFHDIAICFFLFVQFGVIFLYLDIYIYIYCENIWPFQLYMIDTVRGEMK